MRVRTLVLGLGVSAGSVIAPVALASSAHATTYVGPTPPQVTPPAQVVTPAPAAPTAAPSGGLAFTGGDIAGMAIVGAGAIAVGGLLVHRSRSRTSVAS